MLRATIQQEPAELLWCFLPKWATNIIPEQRQGGKTSLTVFLLVLSARLHGVVVPTGNLLLVSTIAAVPTAAIARPSSTAAQVSVTLTI
jgi:hypothetical protein